MRIWSVRECRGVVALCAALGCVTIATAGPDWVEGGENDGDFLPDAGPLPGGAQPININAPVLSVRGALQGDIGAISSAPEGGFGSGDLEDMYLVRIDDFDTFRFGTQLPIVGATEGGPCTSLFLFTGPDHPAGEGLGIVANFDPDNADCGALITGFPTDGATTPALINGLTYYVAVAADGRFPVDAQGNQIFVFDGEFLVGETFDPFEVSGPDGPGGANPIAGWSGFAFSLGQYIVPTIAAVHGVPNDPGVQFEPPEFNDICVGPFGGQTLAIPAGGAFVNGKLEKRYLPGPAPDTWLCVVDKQNNIIAEDDNGANELGNDKASGLFSADEDQDGWADILTDNGDGTRSLRLVVTGFPDGFDGNCNGLFQNAPHGQLGRFCVRIQYSDSVLNPLIGPAVLREDTYTDEFVTGAEAFLINFTAPNGASRVRIEIDNTCGQIPFCGDVDYMCFSGLIPLESYCITVVGGLDKNCNPTDTQLCWLNKDCEVIGGDDDSGPAAGYSELCVIADVNGAICIAVSGGGDANCDGYRDDASTDGFDPTDPFDTSGYHGECGTYTLYVQQNPSAATHQGTTPCNVAEAASRGDVNLDGVVDTVDLVTLLSNWGATTIVP